MSTCPTDALGRSACAEFLREHMAAIGEEAAVGCEIVVSTAPPLVASPYGANGYECEHGVTYWIEPTSEQVMKWNSEGVR